uniref:Uncharacterized protein n=1 Tax=Arundo donax TaxID=35708 RepID=A0A0A9BC23_ARUDO
MYQFFLIPASIYKNLNGPQKENIGDQITLVYSRTSILNLSTGQQNANRETLSNLIHLEVIQNREFHKLAGFPNSRN